MWCEPRIHHKGQLENSLCNETIRNQISTNCAVKIQFATLFVTSLSKDRFFF